MLGAVLIAATGAYVEAQTAVTWKGLDGTDWLTSTNWSTAPTNDTSSSTAVFDTSTSGSVNLSGARSVAGLDIQRTITFYGQKLTLGGTSATYSSGPTFSIAAGANVTFNNNVSKSSGTATLASGATLTYNGQSNVLANYSMAGATINFNGDVNHSAATIFSGASNSFATLNYDTRSTPTAFMFRLSNANLNIKSTAIGTVGTGNNMLRFDSTGTVTLGRDFSLLNANSTAVNYISGGLFVFANNGETATVSGPYTLSVNQLGFNVSGASTLKINGGTIQVGDGTAGKTQGVFVYANSGGNLATSLPGGLNYTVTSDSTGLLRVTGSSVFAMPNVASGSNSQGAQITLTGTTTLVNNGPWANRNWKDTGVATGLSIGASATLSGTGSFDFSSGYTGAGATGIGKTVVVDGVIAPGDTASLGATNGVGTLTITSGTVQFGANSKVAISGSQESLDMLVLNAPVTVTSGAKIDFAATSGLSLGRYSLITGSSGLTGFASDNTPAAYRLALSATEAAIVARPVQSVASLSIGGLSRVMQNQSLMFTGTLSNTNPTGGDSLTVSLSQLAGSNLSLTGSSIGSVAANSSGQISGMFSTGSTLGARTWGVTNTDSNATVTTASGSGTVNVLGNRTVTAASVNFGVVRQGASGTQSFALTSNQSDDSYTRLTVNNTSSGGFAVTGDSAFVFSGTGNSSRTLSGSFATAGAVSGSITLTNVSAETGGTLTGQTPGATSVSYTASVFDGHGTWNLNGGGSWGSQGSSNWTSTGGVNAAPGTFGAGFTNTDIAEFGTTIGSSTGTITLDGAQVSLASLSFTNTAGRYVIQRGTGSGSLTLAAPAGKPFVSVLGTHEIATAILGTSGLQKTGIGKLILSGSNTYSGGTEVTGGTLAVNGSIAGNVHVLTGAELGGSGVIAGNIGGDGLIAPGNSPGVLTVQGQVDPTATTSFAFEFMQQGDPIWSAATASKNDVLQLTNAAPFVNPLTSTNFVNIYFEVASLAKDDIFRGGLFSNYASGDLNFASVIGAPTYQYYVLGSGSGTHGYNGKYYYTLDEYKAANVGLGITGVTASVVTSGTADFSGGTIYNGQVTQFVIIPEPDTIIFAGIGIGMAGWSLWKRRRIAQILQK